MNELIHYGKLGSYKTMSKQEIAKKVAGIAAKTAANVAINDALAKSASKRYMDSGKRASGIKNRSFTKEDLIQTGITTASYAAPLVSWMAGTKLNKVRTNRRANEDRFNSWGKNILPQSVNRVVAVSPDGLSSIIDKRR